MGGNMKVWIAVATWFWWNAVVGPAWSCPVEQHTLSGSCPVEQRTLSWSCPLMVAEQLTLNYPRVTFTTEGVTKTSYTQFIEALRDRLAGGEHSHDIRMMREPSTVLDPQRFVLVELSNGAADSITLAVDVTNASVVAYMSEGKSFFLKEDKNDPPIDDLFPGTERSYFQFSGNYTDLERVAKKDRETIDLGMDPLENAIKALRNSDMGQQMPIARSLIVVIQMVAEAARFKYIEYRVRERIPRAEVFRPTSTMLSYENNWGDLSKAIQQSNQAGVFLNPVQLVTQRGDSRDVDNTNDVAIKGLAIMLFFCRSKSGRASTNINHQHFIDHDMNMIRPVVVDADVATNVDKEFNDDDDDDDICPYPEPTVRISGRNGLCVDVKDGRYNNGNPIQLSPCNQNSDVNQLWTLRKDGTIRSNGMCLTTKGNTQGSQVMINNCAAVENAAATLWQVQENGNIINPQSALVLSAESGNSATTLTVQANIYASRQGWLASNNTEPFVTSIVGFGDLCMQANGDAMWVVECESSKTQQKWALYPDGSIRPYQDRDSCLTSTDNNSQGSTIIISSCSPGSDGQRWVFMNDGTILNLQNGLVMEVKASDPSLHQIIIWPATGNPNQKWLPLF